MFAWMLYVVLVTLILSIGAWLAERAFLVRKNRTRWLWTTAIVASLALPTIVASVSVEMPNILAEPVAQRIVVLRQETNALLSPVMWIAGSVTPPASWRDSDTLVQRLWLGASLAMFAGILASGLLVAWRRRRWRHGTLAGTGVLLTPDTGPAVVGLLDPKIVVPEWLESAAPTHQSAVIAHEQSHLDAGDPRLFTLALALVVLMPWNLPLWWQLRRLRYAIEVDCDARVLKSGVDIRHYGETLISVGERQSAYIGAVAAMSESRSFLEQRIRIMLSKPARWRQVGAAGLIALSVALAGVAAQVSPPNAADTQATAPAQPAVETKPGARVAIKLPGNLLDRYTGHYKLSEQTVVEIKRDGDKLMARLTGQPTFEIFPESETVLFWKVVDAQLHFDLDGTNPAPSAQLHQYGQVMPMTRIDASSAAQFDANLAAKIESQAATPGGEAALRRFITDVAAGTPDYNTMAAIQGKVVRDNLATFQMQLQGMGPVKSMTFRGVGDGGWDIYEVQHANAKMQWRISMTGDGKIGGTLVTALP